MRQIVILCMLGMYSLCFAQTSNPMVEFKLQSLCYSPNRDLIYKHDTKSKRHDYVKEGDTYLIVISDEYRYFSMKIEKTKDGKTDKGFSLPNNYQEIFSYDRQLLDVFIKNGYLCVVADGLYSTEVKEAVLEFKPKTTNKIYKFIFQKQ